MAAEFIVTYLQEATQRVRANTLAGAGELAKNYAASHKGLWVHSIYPVATAAPSGLPLPPPA